VKMPFNPKFSLPHLLVHLVKPEPCKGSSLADQAGFCRPSGYFPHRFDSFVCFGYCVCDP
jgi:hypothetical protein